MQVGQTEIKMAALRHGMTHAPMVTQAVISIILLLPSALKHLPIYLNRHACWLTIFLYQFQITQFQNIFLGKHGISNTTTCPCSSARIGRLIERFTIIH